MDANLYLVKTDENGEKQLFPGFLKSSIGIWIDGNTYWLRENHEKVIAEEEISIVVKEGSFHSRTRIQDVFIRNHGSRPRSLKLLFMHHYSKLDEELFTFVSPAEKVFFHIKNDLMFLVSGHHREMNKEQMTVQPLWSISSENMWKSMEQGILKYQPMAKGVMGSIFSFPLMIRENETSKANAWVVFGDNKNELLQIHGAIKKKIAF